MAQWLIPVTVMVWIEAETLQEAKEELLYAPPHIDIIGSIASYVSGEVSLGEAIPISKKPCWAQQR